jgi:tRNA (guanine10-N2)-methyltransferase
VNLATLIKNNFIQIKIPIAPYGIRESTYKVGSKKIAPIPDEMLSTHFPSKTQYGLGDIYKDLLNFAANNLKLHGRLVFWIPIIR